MVQVGAACLRALGANASAGAGASSGPADAASGGVERILGNFLASDAGRSEVFDHEIRHVVLAGDIADRNNIARTLLLKPKNIDV